MNLTMGYSTTTTTTTTTCLVYLRGALFVAVSVLLFATLHVHVAVEAADSECQNMAASPTLTPFVDELPIMRTIHLTTKRITIGAWKIKQKLHRDLPPTTLYAYGATHKTASFPGPTLEATRNVEANIRWENHITDEEHFLPVDRTLMWANPKKGGVPIVVHLHGAETRSEFDGHPDSWWTSQKEYGLTYTTQDYTYPNKQRATSLWYHDHVVGITRLNVAAGMTALYFLRDVSHEAKLDKLFPPGRFEIPFVVKDLQLWGNGSINFPNIGNSPAFHPVWCPEYFGDTILVNGKAWPHLTVTARVYRFRMLNAANARFFNLTMSNPKLRFIKIGTDSGLLQKPQKVSSLLFAPAERLDVLVDFSTLKAGDVVYFNNSGAAPFPAGTPSFSPPQTNSVMKFKVVACPEADKVGEKEALEAFKDSVVPLPTFSFHNALRRRLVLQEFDDPLTGPIISTLGNRTWYQPVTEKPREGAVEVWELINTTPDAHPIHIHLIRFTVLNQQPFDFVKFTGGTCNITVGYGKPGSCFTGAPEAPSIYQTGQKDTSIVFPSYVTRYGVRFLTADGRPFPFDPTVGPGYVWHCHILDHEDNDMMRPYKVIH